jgi:UDP-4-amino-4,6-dideoxy-N-acetyl-beta-L-altrosamine N-acetyltransferase
MIDDTIIEIEKQLQWFQSLKGNNEKEYLVFYQDEKPIGMLYFSNIVEESCHWGGYIGEDTVWPGSGLILGFAALEYAFGIMKKKQLIAEVFEDNYMAKNMHILFEYNLSEDLKIVTTKQGYEKNIRIFFYTNENWKINRLKIVEKVPNQIKKSLHSIVFL